MNRRAFLTHGLSLIIGGTQASFASAATSSLTLPRPVPRILDLEWLDEKRQRPVPARLYLPVQTHPAYPVPLIVFSHGLGGSREGYRYLASQWAEAGMASLHPQHPGSDHRIWRGNPLDLVQRLQSAADETEAQARVLDLRFSLDRILASEHAPLLDASRIAVAGHSYGANTAMLASGAQVSASRADPVDLRDDRLQAAILISAPPLVGQGPVAQVLGTVSIPTLHITSLEDTINLPGYRSTVEDRIAIFEAMTRSPRTLAVFNTGGHSIFTDRVTRSGPDTSARIKVATRELSTIFLQQSLVDRAPAADAPHGEAHIQQWLARHQTLLDRFTTQQALRWNPSS